MHTRRKAKKDLCSKGPRLDADVSSRAKALHIVIDHAKVIDLGVNPLPALYGPHVPCPPYLSLREPRSTSRPGQFERAQTSKNDITSNQWVTLC